jgi:hypothetical protein
MSGPIRDEWLPPPEHLKDWFEAMSLKMKSDPAPAFNSVVADFHNFACATPERFQQFNLTIDQAAEPKVGVLCTHMLATYLISGSVANRRP